MSSCFLPFDEYITDGLFLYNFGYQEAQAVMQPLLSHIVFKSFKIEFT